MSEKIRPLTIADLELVCEHRERMFAESGRVRDSLKPMTHAFREWLRPKLAEKSYFGWIVEHDGLPIAGVGMTVIDWPPHPSHALQDKRGYVLNMYVEPDHRRRGLARHLMALVHAEAQARGLSYLTLHATRQGQPVYEGLGWTPTTEMGLHLTPPVPIDKSKVGKK